MCLRDSGTARKIAPGEREGEMEGLGWRICDLAEAGLSDRLRPCTLCRLPLPGGFWCAGGRLSHRRPAGAGGGRCAAKGSFTIAGAPQIRPGERTGRRATRPQDGQENPVRREAGGAPQRTSARHRRLETEEAIPQASVPPCRRIFTTQTRASLRPRRHWQSRALPVAPGAMTAMLARYGRFLIHRK